MARLINNKHLFIHSAKTGGTFLREALNRFGVPNFEVGVKHDPYTQFTQYSNRFGFVRHPVTWIRSRWAYATLTYFPQKIQYMPEAQAHWMAPVWDDDINKFVENTLEAHPTGIATWYFDKMLGIKQRLADPIEIYKYEDLIPVTQMMVNKGLEGLGRGVTMNMVANLQAQLSSGGVKANIAESLQKEIINRDRELLNLYY